MTVYDFAAASVRAPAPMRPAAATGASPPPPLGLARPGVRAPSPVAGADSRPSRVTSIAAYRESCATPRGPVWHASARADDGRRVADRVTLPEDGGS